jgi:hypothetical protein
MHFFNDHWFTVKEFFMGMLKIMPDFLFVFGYDSVAWPYFRLAEFINGIWMHLGASHTVNEHSRENPGLYRKANSLIFRHLISYKFIEIHSITCSGLAI